ELERIAGLKSELWGVNEPGDSPTPDYYQDFPENKQPLGRGLHAAGGVGFSGDGPLMIEPMAEYLESKDMPILVNHRVTGLIQNDQGEIIGVRAVVNNWDEQTLGGIATPAPDNE